jgi:hypothetical protein
MLMEDVRGSGDFGLEDPSSLETQADELPSLKTLSWVVL